MKTKLLSNHFKRPGWFLLILSTILLAILYYEILDFETFDFGRVKVKVFAIWELGFMKGETIFGFLPGKVWEMYHCQVLRIDNDLIISKLQ